MTGTNDVGEVARPWKNAKHRYLQDMDYTLGRKLKEIKDKGIKILVILPAPRKPKRVEDKTKYEEANMDIQKIIMDIGHTLKIEFRSSV